MLLKDILYKVAIESVNGSTDISINKIEFDSRKIQEKDVFVAIRGTLSNGHDFIEKAIELGAVAIICDELPSKLEAGITYVKVTDTNSALAFLAANFYQNPSANLKLVGITGTNGKTTIASLVFANYSAVSRSFGLKTTPSFHSAL